MDWHNYFTYSNGLLLWKIRKKGRKLGSAAGSKRSDGYIRVKCSGVDFLAHRIVWEMHYGKIPEGFEIDHINHIRSDNRIENLRIVSRSDNCKNMSISKANKSGFTGVCWSERQSAWHAYINVNRKMIHLGFYSDLNEAIKVRAAAERDNKFHENHGK